MTNLNLNDCKIGPVGMERVSNAIAYNMQIKHLHIALNQGDNYGAKMMATGIEFNGKITFLDMTSNQIKEEGGIAIAMALLKKNRALKKLWLADNYFNDNVGFQLAEATRINKHIVTIKLALNPINDKYVRKIRENLANNLTQSQEHIIPNLMNEIAKLTSRHGLLDYVNENIKKEKEKITAEKNYSNIMSDRLNDIAIEEYGKSSIEEEKTNKKLAKSAKLTAELTKLQSEFQKTRIENEADLKDR